MSEDPTFAEPCDDVPFEPADAGTVDAAAPEVDAGACVSTCEGNGITNVLDGTCFWEQCRGGYRGLVAKPAGVECVYRDSENAFVVGHCDDHAECH